MTRRPRSGLHSLKSRETWLVLFLAAALGGPCVRLAQGEDPAVAATRRGLDYLSREVPRWHRENHCFSCHNNGDGARALLSAPLVRDSVGMRALEDTIAWLRTPERWKTNGVDAAFSDKRLARLQFTVALATAVENGRITDRTVLIRAAEEVVRDQDADGSWQIADGGTVGSPATYGPPLATALARRTLRTAGAERFSAPIARAGSWLRSRPTVNVVDASATLFGLEPDNRSDGEAGRRALALLARAQGEDGGFGPFVNAAPEPFDTAIALLAMMYWSDHSDLREPIKRARAYLAASQGDDGSWPETTRPASADSYAQRVSTAGWATLALLKSR